MKKAEKSNLAECMDFVNKTTKLIFQFLCLSHFESSNEKNVSKLKQKLNYIL